MENIGQSKKIPKNGMDKIDSAVITKQNQIRVAESVLREKHTLVSDTVTPSFYVKDKNGLDYVDEAYMRHQLNKHYPIWDWEIKEWKFLGDKSIVVHGKLSINDNGVLRSFDAVAAHRVAISRNSGEYVDLGNDLKAANSDCFKVAVNRLCNVADDVYRKKVEDISLSADQKKEILLVIGNADDRTKNRINYSLSNGDINRSNYDRAIVKLKEITSNKVEGDK